MKALRLLAGSLTLALSSFHAHAGPMDPVSVSPAPAAGESFSPGVRLTADLRQSYIEEEYLVSGTANLYNYANNPPQGPTDLVITQADVPYTTRMIVRYPSNPKRFNGTVVIEWWNSTAGFDTAPSWDPSAEYFARKGIVYVGVTNSTTSIEHLKGGCRLLGITAATCEGRYDSLSLPENGLAFEMMSQIATLFKNGGSASPLPTQYEVQRLMHVGESQQGGSLVTYASAFHLEGINDGYFIQAAINARPINFGPECGVEGSPDFPECTPRLEFPDTNVRSDLPVPVYQLNTQTDYEELNFGTRGRQPDTEFYRYYEVPGAAHLTVHKGVELIPPGVLGPDPVRLEDLCENEINTTGDGPVFSGYVLNALWKRMQEQIDTGVEPPPGILMDQVDGELVRDEQGNVLGGVRMPSVEAPLATYLSSNQADPTLPDVLVNIGNLACRLGGSVIPFDEATLDMLYPRRSTYIRQVKDSVRTLRRQGFLLKPEAKSIIESAREVDLGS